MRQWQNTKLFLTNAPHTSDENYLVQKPLHAMEENMHLLKDLGCEDELYHDHETLRMMAGPSYGRTRSG